MSKAHSIPGTAGTWAPEPSVPAVRPQHESVSGMLSGRCPRGAGGATIQPRRPYARRSAVSALEISPTSDAGSPTSSLSLDDDQLRDAEPLRRLDACGRWPATCSWPLVTPLPRWSSRRSVQARGNFDVANDRHRRAAFARRPATEIAAGLRTQADSRFHAAGLRVSRRPSTELLAARPGPPRAPLGLQPRVVRRRPRLTSRSWTCSPRPKARARPSCSRGAARAGLRVRGLRRATGPRERRRRPGARRRARRCAYAMAGRRRAALRRAAAGARRGVLRCPARRR